VKPQDFQYLQRALKERSGIVLSSDKAYLVESRLTPVARKRGLAGVDELLAVMRKGDSALQVEIVDAMTTNESLFFRDIKPFEGLRDTVLPAIVAAKKATGGRPRIRIWCAACSSGQEPYSIAMLIREQAAVLAGVQFDILATDISTEMVARAVDGTYSQFEVQRGLPIRMLIKYFNQIGDRWRLDESIRKMVEFRQFNLLDGYRSLGAFDIVFCRNVLIYFDQPTKTAVLDRIGEVLAKQGVLFLGGAESVLGISSAFKPYPGLRGAYALARFAGAGASAQRATA
jgi:chemotaxis protein methyltransferase CheR